MKISLIATDLDGTLLDEEKRVPEKNMEALRKCADRGIEIVPCTGRTVRGIPEALKKLPGVRYAITTNGAVVADLKEDRLIGACRLPAEIALKVLELAEKSRDDIMYDVYIDGDGYTMDRFLNQLGRYVKTAGMEALVRKTREVVPDTIEFVRAQGRDVDKINLFFVEPDAKERMRKELKAVDGILVSSSIPNNLEINAAGADKGGALLRLAEYLGIPREETMAFGDGENDRSLMEKAGFSVAMKNGGEEIRAAADHVTGTNEESGVAEAIEMFVL